MEFEGLQLDLALEDPHGLGLDILEVLDRPAEQHQLVERVREPG